MSKLKLNVIESLDGTFQINVKDLNAGIQNIKRFGAIGDGTNIDGPSIQQALNSGAKAVYIPAGTWLLDEDLIVPAGVELYGCGPSSILRMVGRDTHGRNCLLFEKYKGQSISAAPAMVVCTGSNSTLRNFVCDGNGQNNYTTTAGYPTYIDEANNTGYCGVRLGRLTNRQPSDPKTFIENSIAENIKVTLCAWGGILISGFGYRFAQGDTTTDEDLIGARYCHIRYCTTENTFSNNITLQSARDCSIVEPTVINNVHKGITTYVRCRDILIDTPKFIYDPTTDVSWKGDANVTNYRERELGTRSDAIAIGHSDYDTLMQNITVIGAQLNGNGMIRNGINVYSGTKNITLKNNDIRGFISPLAIGVSSDLSVIGGSLSCSNYTSTEISPGTEYIGSDIQFTARSVENTKTKPANICVQAFTGILFSGKGVNNIRGNSWSVWNAMDAGLQAHFSSNTYNTQNLNGIGAATPKHLEINTSPTSTNPSSIHFENEKHVTPSGNSYSGEDLYSSNVLWTFVWPLGMTFLFTPTPIGSSSQGVATITAASGRFQVGRAFVSYLLEVGWSSHTGTGNLRVTGLPVTSRSTLNGGIPQTSNLHFSGLTYTGQASAVIQNSSNTIDLYGLTSGGGLTNIPIDSSVNVLRISGSYQI